MRKMIDGIEVIVPFTAEEIAAQRDPDRFQVREYDDDGSGRVFRVETFEDSHDAVIRYETLRAQGHEAGIAAVYETEDGEIIEPALR